MSEELKASPIEAIGVPTKVVTLPEEGPAGPIRIEIRKCHPAVLIAATGNLPAFEVGKSRKNGPAEVARMLAASKQPLAAVAREGIVAPPFSFDETPEAGKAHWASLSWGNQLELYKQIMAYAGLQAEVKEGTDADAARKVARFPGGMDRPQGRGHRVRGGAGGRGGGKG